MTRPILRRPYRVGPLGGGAVTLSPVLTRRPLPKTEWTCRHGAARINCASCRRERKVA